ncbi:hypothetical protein N657DRAFT_637903 [Parathielavia appendiculata]|uniref:Uncharacterized protein n=1 Tax=Parathielavia appendiculata TaxID=2587402 RepID=A0AAN6TQ98_9PEZI|nr:hypothetical protein N657DRAFT_637903 [Parathielavia appendiculata]
MANAQIHGVKASNGGTVRNEIHIGDSHSQRNLNLTFNKFVFNNYPPDRAQQLLAAPEIARFAIPVVTSLQTGHTHPEMSLSSPIKHGAALDEDETRTGAPGHTDLHLDDAVNRDAPLYILDVYEDDYEHLKRRYDVDDDMEAFPESLYQKDCAAAHEDDIRNAVSQWLHSSRESALLTIDGSEYDDHWTTRFAVEAVHDARLHPKHQRVCHHFCGERPGEKGPWPSRVVAHLLAQLGPTQDAKTADLTQSHHNCVRADMVPVDKLWGLLGGYVRAAGIDSITIILDRIDVLYCECADVKATERFFAFLKGLSWLMRLGPVVRVMVTSRNLDSEILERIRTAC